MREEATIVALSTPLGTSGVAVIRLSGSASSQILRRVFRGVRHPCDTPFTVCIGTVRTQDSEVIDRTVAFFLPNPRSFTGEDMAEIQCHGNPLIIEEIIEQIVQNGARLAHPGEFTQRAFENGKIDLSQAEGISDLIHAESRRALKLANEQLAGRLSRAVADVGEPLRETLAQIEAYIDFPEEEIEPAAREVLVGDLRVACGKIIHLLGTYKAGIVAREGFRMLLCGRPNAGKSSLMNRLLGTNRAIVTDIAGTTRDVIEERMMLGGYSVILCDSAGITETTDLVEKIGVDLALDRVKWADLVCLLVDSTDGSAQALAEVRSVLSSVLDALGPESATPIWLVLNKIDLPSDHVDGIVQGLEWKGRIIRVSTKDDELITPLKEELTEYLNGLAATGGVDSDAGAGVILTNARHKRALELALEHLHRALELFRARAFLEIISEEVRLGLLALEEIVGRTYSDDILGRIFSKFCIGK
jgi:tRNA modification GTPase